LKGKGEQHGNKGKKMRVKSGDVKSKINVTGQGCFQKGVKDPSSLSLKLGSDAACAEGWKSIFAPDVNKKVDMANGNKLRTETLWQSDPERS